MSRALACALSFTLILGETPLQAGLLASGPSQAGAHAKHVLFQGVLRSQIARFIALPPADGITMLRKLALLPSTEPLLIPERQAAQAAILLLAEPASLKSQQEHLALTLGPDNVSLLESTGLSLQNLPEALAQLAKARKELAAAEAGNLDLLLRELDRIFSGSDERQDEVLATAADSFETSPGGLLLPKLQPAAQDEAGSKAAAPKEPPRPPQGTAQPDKPGFIKKFLKPIGRFLKAIGPQSKAEKWFWNSLGLGIIAAVSAPALYGTQPLQPVFFLILPAAMALPTIALGSLILARLIHFLRLKGRVPEKQATPPRGRARAAAIGLALGLSLGLAPQLLKAPLIEKGSRIVAPRLNLRRVRGTALQEEIISLLSRNPVGREILEHQRDRSGAIRLPDFFVGDLGEPGDKRMGETLAFYNPKLDAIYLSKRKITERGWSVEDFAGNPKLQRQYAREAQFTLVHELLHANQHRRSIFSPGQFSENLEHEYEAYIVGHLYLHEMLKADPRVALDSDDLGNYESMLDDLEGALDGLNAKGGGYEGIGHIDSPYHQEYMARIRAGWPAHRVEGYLLLARRHSRFPWLTLRYLDRAQTVAALHRLPRPALEIPKRASGRR